MKRFHGAIKGTKHMADTITVEEYRRLRTKKPDLGDEFDKLWNEVHPELPFKQEVRFCGDRKWRVDRARGSVVVELEGGAWTGGRHTRGKGFIADCDKYNWLAVHGFTVLRFTTFHLKNRRAEVVELVTQALNRMQA